MRAGRAFFRLTAEPLAGAAPRDLLNGEIVRAVSPTISQRNDPAGDRVATEQGIDRGTGVPHRCARGGVAALARADGTRGHRVKGPAPSFRRMRGTRAGPLRSTSIRWSQLRTRGARSRPVMGFAHGPHPRRIARPRGAVGTNDRGSASQIRRIVRVPPLRCTSRPPPRPLQGGERTAGFSRRILRSIGSIGRRHRKPAVQALSGTSRDRIIIPRQTIRGGPGSCQASAYSETVQREHQRNRWDRRSHTRAVLQSAARRCGRHLAQPPHQRYERLAATYAALS